MLLLPLLVSLLLLSQLQTHTFPSLQFSGWLWSAVGSIPSVYKSQCDVRGSAPPHPPPTSSPHLHPHLPTHWHNPLHPSIHPSLSSHWLFPPATVSSFHQTSLWHHKARGFCVRVWEIWLFHLMNAHSLKFVLLKIVSQRWDAGVMWEGGRMHNKDLLFVSLFGEAPPHLFFFCKWCLFSNPQVIVLAYKPNECLLEICSGFFCIKNHPINLLLKISFKIRLHSRNLTARSI